MKPYLFIVAVYAMAAIYLAFRGVPARRVGAILLCGAVAGLVITVIDFSKVLRDGGEEIATDFTWGLLLAVIVMERDTILGTMTTLGIVLLDVAVAIAPVAWPMPMAFLGMPALMAVGAMLLGQENSRWLRIPLAIWMGWVAIAMVSGPAADVRTSDPWHVQVVGAFTLMHVIFMGASLILAGLLALGDRGAALATTVRMDAMNPWIAFAIAAGFTIACLTLNAAPLPAGMRANAMIGGALMLGALFSDHARREQAAAAAALALEAEADAEPG